jgi:hypothetical protein
VVPARGHTRPRGRRRLDVADRRGEPAYLEATSPRNRALYERHGFEVVDELRTGDCPPLWGMWRKPNSSRVEGFMERSERLRGIASSA